MAGLSVLVLPPVHLYHTTDGGDTWTVVPDFQGAYFAWILKEKHLGTKCQRNIIIEVLTTVQPGFKVTFPVLQLSNFRYWISLTKVLVMQLAGGVKHYRSIDGGITWEILPTPNSDDKFTDIYLLSANELWVSSTNDVAYYSATGGQSWSVMDIGSTGFGIILRSIVAVQGGDAWTVGDQGYIEHFTGPPPPPANQLPSASFEFSAAGLTVDFTDTSIDPDGFIVSWDWNFGDGTGSTQQHPSHTFDTANTYHVTLIVTDDDGATDGVLQFIAVQPGPGGTFGDFTEVTPLDSLFITPQDEDFWVITTAPADYD